MTIQTVSKINTVSFSDNDRHRKNTGYVRGYGTLQAPEFDEQDRLADAPVEKTKTVN